VILLEVAGDLEAFYEFVQYEEFFAILIILAF
jgi:hypothetical protein